MRLTWDDFADLSEIVPLLARVYPNGSADVNQFHQAGGMQFLIRDLLGAGLLHEDVKTVWGTGLSGYANFALNGFTPALYRPSIAPNAHKVPRMAWKTMSAPPVYHT